MRRLVCFYIFNALALSCSLASDLPNPFIPQRADPWITRDASGVYYFTASVPEYDRIELRSSSTLEGLASAEPKTIWRRHASGPMSWHIWAPELHHIDGKWVVYFAAGEKDAIWNIRMYVLENRSSDPMTGEWIERGQIKTPWDTFALDATQFEHAGRRYLVWAQHEPGFEGNTALWIAELANAREIKGLPVKLSEPEFEWETQLYKVNEGAAVIKRKDRVFIAYSASGTDHNYAMGLLWAPAGSDFLDAGSWRKGREPVFKSDPDNGIYGPGHCSFTTDAEGRDILVYHARSYKELKGSPLRDPNRHTRLHVVNWTSEGFPDFGRPLPDSVGRVAARPLYRDPTYDGAADPVVIWNRERARWWMFYTNRRANVADLSGVAWVHGTRIGVAESADGGATWKAIDPVQIELPAPVGGEQPTHWAPDVIAGPDGRYHMYLTVVPGVFEDWNHPRSIVHLESLNLVDWQYVSTLSLASDRVIDASVMRLGESHWRMWYNNERDAKSIYYADSEDLYNWVDRGKAVADQLGEGPVVFKQAGQFWMICDVWEGLAVYRSADALNWERQPSNLLDVPGRGPDDGVNGQHPEVIVQDDAAYLFYFTHPDRAPGLSGEHLNPRRSTLHVTEIQFDGGYLSVDRDKPVPINLDPGKE